MRYPYKGETHSKGVARQLVWLQHERMLGRTVFRRLPHLFLASRVAGDVDVLRAMGASSDNIWAIESNPIEYRQLFDRQQKEGFRLMTRKIEDVVEEYAPKLHSVYLDFCGNIQGTALVRNRVVSNLTAGSVLSITNFIGRETSLVEDREVAIETSVRRHTQCPVSLVQSVTYTSSMDGVKGSPMTTWTFAVGVDLSSRGKMRFNLNKDEISLFGDSEVKKLWESVYNKAVRRRMAAMQANETRRRVG